MPTLTEDAVGAAMDALIQVGDRRRFKRILLLCLPNPTLAAPMCGWIVRMYPEQVDAIAKALLSLDRPAS